MRERVSRLTTSTTTIPLDVSPTPGMTPVGRLAGVMGNIYRIVDLFAGPGGLAEGFSTFQTFEGERPFRMALSIEKDAAAFRTLVMRSFFRQFADGAPREYYEFLAAKLTKEELVARYQSEWRAAKQEALHLELGNPIDDEALDHRLDEIARGDTETVLIGGPPCQAYSLAGRARNIGVTGYRASKDHRHYLYREYIRIIRRVQPAAFVMENVKGLLSSRVEKELIFEKVLEDLRMAGGAKGSYTLVPLASPANEHNYIVRAEDYGVPQCRHRVIIVGVRSDLAPKSDGKSCDLLLSPRAGRSTVGDVIGGLPMLRSGLSRSHDGPLEWRAAVAIAFRTAAEACFRGEASWSYRVGQQLIQYGAAVEDLAELPRASSARGKPVDNPDLEAWFFDPRIRKLPNHETRAHMPGDLARYAFAATFAEEMERSPKASEYPIGLAPDHRNWSSGKFADRFRVQLSGAPSTTITSHISKDGHYFIHPDPQQCRSLTVREAARLQTFPDNYVFLGNRTEQFVQVGNAVPPLLAREIAAAVFSLLQGGNKPKERLSERPFALVND